MVAQSLLFSVPIGALLLRECLDRLRLTLVYELRHSDTVALSDTFAVGLIDLDTDADVQAAVIAGTVLFPGSLML